MTKFSTREYTVVRVRSHPHDGAGSCEPCNAAAILVLECDCGVRFWTAPADRSSNDLRFGEWAGGRGAEDVRLRVRMPNQNLAVELLASCGMIRRSKKRRLIGAEAQRIRNSVLGSSIYKDRASALSVEQVPRSSSSWYERFTSGNRTVLPLLNIFQKFQRLNG